MAKQRLDLVIIQQRPDLSRAFIQSIIMQGKVKVEGQIITKAGTLIAPDAQIDMDVTQPKYVSRAGFKLEAALDAFNVDVNNLIALDAGISTGGFSDCMLQRGIAKIYGIDVGYGQVHEKVRNDARVIIMERTNLRHLTSLPEIVDLVTLDLSFISVLKVIDAVKNVMKPGAKLIVLVKPQFEAERFQIGKGGIVNDPTVHEAVVQKVTSGISREGFEYKGIIESPILGGDGNKEFLALFIKK
ncbi:MAG TPA: TlyA family RNA methyltransferase [Candidatus Babeliales bacterium]|nr:TlyA family RNA methyltransferase [Candidatus Babeliales bacterium]